MWDTNGDGELSHEEVAAVTTIGTVFQNNTDIEFFNELKHFSGLTALEANAFSVVLIYATLPFQLMLRQLMCRHSKVAPN